MHFYLFSGSPLDLAKRSTNNAIYIDARQIQHMGQPNGLPSYDEVQKEDREKSNVPLVSK